MRGGGGGGAQVNVAVFLSMMTSPSLPPSMHGQEVGSEKSGERRDGVAGMKSYSQLPPSTSAWPMRNNAGDAQEEYAVKLNKKAAPSAQPL